MDEQRPKAIRFGPFEMDRNSGELRRDGMRVKLQPQPCKVLLLLLDRPGELVTREEIQKEVWDDSTFVDFEKGLNFCIKQIRTALNDSAETPRYVETAPKRGYRFIYPVKSLEDEAPAPAPRDAPEGPPGEQSLRPALWILAGLAVLLLLSWLLGGDPDRIRALAVLPLADLSNDETQVYFAEGMTDSVISELGKISPFRVISWQSVKQYRGSEKPLPDIAEELGVDAIVEGSLLRESGKIRITVQLIRVSPERHLWATSYDREDRDALTLVRDLAEDIAREIQNAVASVDAKPPAEQVSRAVPIGPGSPNVIPPVLLPEAHEAYLKGRYFLNQRTPETIQKGLNYFDQAAALDPDFALAHAGRADAYALLGSIPYDALPPLEAMPQSKAAALQALKLDDTLAEAHTTLGYISMVFDHDWKKAEQEFLRALELNPNYVEAHHWYGYCLEVLQRPDDALERARIAQQLDPVSLPANAAVGWHHYFRRNYDRGIRQMEKTLEINPYSPLARFSLGMIHARKGNYEEATRQLQQALEVAPGCAYCRAGLGYNYALAGQTDEAEKILDNLRRLSERQYVPSFYLVAIYGALGRKDEALRWLEKAYEQRSDYVIYAGVEPAFDPLRGEPGFQELLLRLKIPGSEVQ